MHSGYLLNFVLVIEWKEAIGPPSRAEHYNSGAPVPYRRICGAPGVSFAYDVLCIL